MAWIPASNRLLLVSILTVDLPKVNKIVLSYGKNIGGHCFPPDEVEVWAGEDKAKLSMIKKIKVDQPTGYESLKVEALTIPLEICYSSVL